MNPDCNILNPLQRDGTSQQQRLVRALHPSNVLVDERELSDLLLYAREYASLLRYYDTDNREAGDWVAFIEADISTLVSMIGREDLSPLRTQFESAATLAGRFAPLLLLFEKADKWHRQSIPGLQLHSALQKEIGSTLNDLLRNTIAYGLRAIETGAIGATDLDYDRITGDIWSLAHIQPDPVLFPSGDGTDPDDLAFAGERLHNTFREAYDRLLAIVDRAPAFLEETLEAYPAHAPHMALFLTFLALFKIAQNHLNTLTKRHLDFYYQEVLQIHLRPAQPDKVHLVFQLAKGFQEAQLNADTFLKAGKDEAGANLFFATDEEIALNRTQLDEVDGLKTVFLNKEYALSSGDDAPTLDTDYDILHIHAAPDADSADGLGTEFEGEDSKWWTVGGPSMPPATIGWAVASPLFLLSEARREVSLTFYFEKNEGLDLSLMTGGDADSPQAYELRHNVRVQYTGEKGWVDAPVTGVVLSSGDEAGQLSIKWKIEIGPGLEPAVPYNPEVYPENYATKYPVLRFLLDNDGLAAAPFKKIDDSYDALNNISKIKAETLPFDKTKTYQSGQPVFYKNNWYRALSDDLSGVFPDQDAASWEVLPRSYPYRYLRHLDLSALNLEVYVENMQNLILESDAGVLDPGKPFLPFGPIPKVGSKFYIGHPEVFQKPLKSETGGSGRKALSLDITWSDLPEESFVQHYAAYRDSSPKPDNDNEFTVDIQKLETGSWSDLVTGQALFDSNTSSSAPAPVTPLQLDDVFAAAPSLQDFDRFTPELTRGFIRLELNKSFLHKYYASSVTNVIANPSLTVAPNEPYTPTFSELKLSYRAEETLDFNNQLFEDRSAQLFHIGPFGWEEFYPFDTGVAPEEAVVDQKIVPLFLMTEPDDEAGKQMTDAEGNLYLGLKELAPEQNVSFLFQMAEGSADPEKNKQAVVWSFLQKNRWVDFDTTQILSDTTNGLLTSGIITLVLPAGMTDDNTILPAGLFWIRASVARETAAISKNIAVLPQAVRASFRPQEGNDLNRLNAPLPARTVGKLRERRAAIKKVLQPFASFGGKVKEQNEAPPAVSGEDRFRKEYNEYYVRVSERLRHKNRAVTIFDYERLVLQAFPDIYKAKCLNHTRMNRAGTPNSEHSPGDVTMVLIRNLRNENAVDPLRPMVSLNRLEEIKTFLRPLHSDFVTLDVINPLFEEVRVRFNVRFLPGKDKGFYTKKLQEDIVRFLSPWLYDEGGDLQLGGKVHRSVILNYIEETDYVDFVTDFKMDHLVSDTEQREDVEEAVATTSASVLVSVPAIEHSVNPEITIKCSNQPS